MLAVKVLHKGQITLPREIRKNLGIKEGDMLIIDEADGDIVMRKGKTIHDYIGFLPRPAVSIEEIIERATEEAVNERV